ncbi:MAG: NADPH-dependent 7-cyano-7-deazaguanine reductase QueF [Pseudomonadota bacterium]|nr:NADPH-dependent 7-cyano-7-deazaguanine reductase QueF [Pseudomonadota bacterium]
MNQVEQSSLGQTTEYPQQYAPEVLFPIPRSQGRQHLIELPYLSQGMDWWHVFELSWLDHTGKPQVAIGRLSIPANSVNLIESKSLKLYFNSLNFEVFSDAAALITCVEADLSQAAQATVRLTLLTADALPVSQPTGQCLDDLPLVAQREHPDASLLCHLDASAIADQQFYTHLLRSNCPVTGQPDWGTVFIRYQGQQICPQHLLAYIISFRRHNGFHEQCVEQIFADLWQYLQPQRLMVYATYTRRGGLDINPCRSSDPAWLVDPIRLARQ